MDLMMTKVIPVAGSLYVARLVSGKLAGRIPGMDMVPEKMRGPALAALLLGIGHFATGRKSPVKMLKKQREGIMVGLGINLVDKLLVAFAPADVSGMFGLSGDEDIYGPALADYVSVDDYVQIGNVPPIQDDITLADYVQIGQYEGEGLEEDLGAIEQDLGMLEQDLGVEMDLGNDAPRGADFADRRLGGVTRSSMAAPIGRKRYLAPVPARSFTKQVPHFNDAFDASGRVYAGIFNGGFGF